ncbi:MAG: DUF6588 family protein [Bacteroidales bacterium]
MKRNIQTIVISACLLSSAMVMAQMRTAPQFVKGSVDDAVKIIKAYALPVEKSLALNNANNSLMPLLHQELNDLKFGIGLTSSVSIVNSADLTYNIMDLQLTEFEPADPQRTIAQTYAGSANTIPLQTQQKYYVPSSSFPFYSTRPVLTLNSPEGYGVRIMPYAAFHLFGASHGNLIDLKFIPPIKYSPRNVGLFNISLQLQYNLNSLFKDLDATGLKFYLSGGYGYNKVSNYLEIKPNEAGLTFSPSGDKGPYDNQELQLLSVSIPLRFYLFKTSGAVAIMVGGGYNLLDSKVSLKGNYPIYSTDPTNHFQVIVKDLSDPFSYSRNFNTYALDGGISFTFEKIILGLLYSYSSYSNLNLSFGFTL